jgi:hypothetical protein
MDGVNESWCSTVLRRHCLDSRCCPQPTLEMASRPPHHHHDYHQQQHQHRQYVTNQAISRLPQLRYALRLHMHDTSYACCCRCLASSWWNHPSLSPCLQTRPLLHQQPWALPLRALQQQQQQQQRLGKVATGGQLKPAHAWPSLTLMPNALMRDEHSARAPQAHMMLNCSHLLGHFFIRHCMLWCATPLAHIAPGAAGTMQPYVLLSSSASQASPCCLIITDRPQLLIHQLLPERTLGRVWLKHVTQLRAAQT